MLTERGLEPAVEALATRAPLPVEARRRRSGERLPGPVEAAAYYVVAEALTNVAKYARASEVTVGVERGNGHALHRGPRRRRRRRGGRAAAPGCAGSPTASRRSAGGFVLDSPAGAGTTLRAEIPAR